MITVFLPLATTLGPYEVDLLTLIERTALEDARTDARQGGDVSHRDWHCYRRLYTAERALR